LFQQFITYL